MILTEEILLPKYQRSFVWKLKDAVDFIDSIRNERFVPPVIIASFSGDPNIIGRKGIYLVDGQQRLSSLLLFYLGYWFVGTANTGDEESEEDAVTKWSFTELQKLYKGDRKIEALREKLKNNRNYTEIGAIPPSRDGVINTDIIEKAKNLSEEFRNGDYIDERALGFSFIKSIAGGIEIEKNLFAHIFKDINTTGSRLRPEESRKALYCLQPDLIQFFMPDFISAYKISNQPIDFGKYLALVGKETYKGYKETGNINTKVAVGYAGKKLNDYTVEYVTGIVERNIADEKAYLKNMDNVEKYWGKIFEEKKIPNTKEFDIRIFGLLFWVLFDGRKLKDENIEDLKANIKKYNADKSKENETIGNIRARLEFSINIFEEYLEDA